MNLGSFYTFYTWFNSVYKIWYSCILKSMYYILSHHLLSSVQFYCVHSAGLDGRLGQSWGDSGHWCYKQTWLYRPGTQEAWTLWPGVSVQPARQEGETAWNINIVYSGHMLMDTTTHAKPRFHCAWIFSGCVFHSRSIVPKLLLHHKISQSRCEITKCNVLYKDQLYIQCCTHMHWQMEIQYNAEVISVLPKESCSKISTCSPLAIKSLLNYYFLTVWMFWSNKQVAKQMLIRFLENEKSILKNLLLCRTDCFILAHGGTSCFFCFCYAQNSVICVESDSESDKKLGVGDSSPSSLSNGSPCIVCPHSRIIGNQSLICRPLPARLACSELWLIKNLPLVQIAILSPHSSSTPSRLLAKLLETCMKSGLVVSFE